MVDENIKDFFSSSKKVSVRPIAKKKTTIKSQDLYYKKSSKELFNGACKVICSLDGYYLIKNGYAEKIKEYPKGLDLDIGNIFARRNKYRSNSFRIVHNVDNSDFEICILSYSDEQIICERL